MIQLEQAKSMVLEYVSEKWGKVYQKEYVINDGGIVDYGFAWYITFTEKENGDFWVGVKKGCIVDKINGDIFQPGSAYPVEDWIWGFKIGLRGKPVDLVIYELIDFKLAIGLLDELGLREVTFGDIDQRKNFQSRITKDQLGKKLLKLPCMFKYQNLTIKIWVFREIAKSKALKFKIQPSSIEA